MSLNVVREQIERFLASSEPEVMAIRGAWGVGKTYTWNKLLNERKENDGIKLKTYSYVSLFGIHSLEALKYSVFEQSIGVELIGKHPSLETFKTNADKLCLSLGKKSFYFFQDAPVIKNFASAIQSASFLSLRNSIICIDDFERKSDRVSIKEILGLVMLLKEQRNCKIVLIFNDGKMGAANSDEYKIFREKVIDFEIEFKPTSKECVEIALPIPNELMIEVGEHINKLSISNIRIIKKIERMANLIYPHLKDYEKEVLSQAIHTLCLYSLCFYSSDKSIPGLEYVKSIGYRLFGLDDEKEQSDDEKGWNAFLREYGYQHADEFDLRISEAVENGYAHIKHLMEEAEKLNAQLIATKSASSFSKAWDLYHNSFSNNQEAVVQGLYESFKDNAKFISLVNFNGTVRLFREIGEDDLANELIDIYIEVHKANKTIFDLNCYSFSGDISDPMIRERFAQLTDEGKEIITVKDVLSKISVKNGCGRDDEKVLSNSSAEDFYDVFKSEDGEHLSRYVDSCLQFGRFNNPSEQQKKIAVNATIALQKIGKESPLNERRVNKFGIKLDAINNEQEDS